MDTDQFNELSVQPPVVEPSFDKQAVLAEVGRIARALYELNGLHAPADFKFRDAIEVNAKTCWQYAAQAFINRFIKEEDAHWKALFLQMPMTGLVH